MSEWNLTNGIARLYIGVMVTLMGADATDDQLRELVNTTVDDLEAHHFDGGDKPVSELRRALKRDLLVHARKECDTLKKEKASAATAEAHEHD